VLTAVAVGQTAAFVAVFVVWVCYAFRPLFVAAWRRARAATARVTLTETGN
jgi:hypothetical protein